MTDKRIDNERRMYAHQRTVTARPEAKELLDRIHTLARQRLGEESETYRAGHGLHTAYALALAVSPTTFESAALAHAALVDAMNEADNGRYDDGTEPPDLELLLALSEWLLALRIQPGLTCWPHSCATPSEQIIRAGG